MAEDYSPGRCSEGGIGSITCVHRGSEKNNDHADVMMEECSSVDVQYVLTGWVEKDVSLIRLHAVPFTLKVTFLFNYVLTIFHVTAFVCHRSRYQFETFGHEHQCQKTKGVMSP